MNTYMLKPTFGSLSQHCDTCQEVIFHSDRVIISDDYSTMTHEECK